MHPRHKLVPHGALEGRRLAMLVNGLVLVAALLGVLLCRAVDGNALPGLREAAVPDSRPSYTEDALRRSLDQLAERIGTLQGRLAALDVLGRRLADVAGVMPAHTGSWQSTAPASPPHELPATKEDSGPAQALGRDIDALAAALTVRWLALQWLESVLAPHQAALASLPSSLPLADYPVLSSPFGWRLHPVSGRRRHHDGLDFAAPRGTPILAAAGGIVRASGTVRGYGKRLDIDHGAGLVSRYAHASELLVKAGDIVSRGQVVARVGSSGLSTGPHLHFEVRMGTQAVDPRLFLGRLPTAPPTVASAAARLLR